MRRSLWISSLITLAGLIIFIGIAAAIPRPASNSGALLLGVFLALVPGVIWLGFFYQQDRAEPEPKQLVIRMFAFGALAAVLMPLVDQTIGQTVSQTPNLVLRLLLTMLTLSLIQEVLKVAMVRYVVLGTNEFDQHPDGIVYGLASGLGFATILTLTYFMRTDGVIPLAGAMRAVDNALVHAVLGAVSGYYIGRVKIDGKKLGWMIQGLAIVTTVNGLYQVTSDELSRRLTFNPWYSLGVAILLALVVGAVLFAFFQRALRRATGELKTVSIQAHARSKEMPWDIHVRYDYLLVGALALALIVGGAAGWVMSTQTVAFVGSDQQIDFRYPFGWAIEQAGTSSVTIHDLTGAGVLKPTITVSSNKIRGGGSLDFLTVQDITGYGDQQALYNEMGRDDGVSIGGDPAMRVEYQYAASTASGPVVVRGIADYVLVGERLYVFRYEAQADVFSAGLTRYEQLLRTVHFAAEQ